MSLSPDTMVVIDVVREEVGKIQRGNDEIYERITRLESRVEKISCGFPNEDPEGHRLFHEAYMRRQEIKTKIMEGAAVKIGQGGIITFLLALIALTIALIKMELGK